MRVSSVPSLFLSTLFAAAACAPADPPAPDAGENNSVPTDGGGSNETPDAGGSNETPDAGENNETPDAGENNGTPDAGSTSNDFPAAKYTTWNKSGTRLTAKATTDAVGNSAIAWFTDGSKGLDCEPAKATDGTIRCLPFADPSVELFIGDMGGLFADGSCTENVIKVRSACTTQTIRGLPQSNGRKVVQLGTEATTLFQTQADRNGNPLCLAYSAPAGSKYFRYTELAPTEFVAFTEAEVEVEGRVGLTVLNGADGSGTVYGLRDTTSNKPAALYGSNRLAAYTFSVRSFELAPSSCGGPINAAIGTPPGSYNPDYVEVILMTGGPGPGPGPGQPIPQLRKVLSAQNFHCRNGTQQVVSASEAVYVLEDAATDPMTLPLVTNRGDSRTNVLGFTHYTTESGAPISPIPAGVSIAAARVPGAQGGVFLRNGAPVVPTIQFNGTELFSDATCTTPVVSEFSGNQGDTIVVTDSNVCSVMPGIEGLVKGVYTVTGQVPTPRPVYASDGGTGCNQVGDERYRTLTSQGAAADALFAVVPLTNL